MPNGRLAQRTRALRESQIKRFELAEATRATFPTDELALIDAVKGEKELELLDLAIPGFGDLPIGELMAVPFSLATTTALPDDNDNQQLSGRQAFLWTHISIIATDSNFAWVLEDSFYQGRFTFDASQIRAQTLSGLGDNQDNKQPTPLPCAQYLPSNTSLTFFVTDLSGIADNVINVTLLGLKVRRGSAFHQAVIRRMAYIGMGGPQDIAATE